MRADRLVAILLLLQKHGKLPASWLASELQVSERTIYRDIEALSGAGIPIYSETGRAGGFSLVENYRTTLTGLNQDEVRALFMLALPETLAEFGMASELRTAMLKLSAALPAAWRSQGKHDQSRIYLDLHGSTVARGGPERLPILYEAVMHDRQVEMSYRLLFGTPAVMVQTVDPLGLVAHEGDWSLVYRRQEHIRALGVRGLQEVRLLPSGFSRPPDFQLVNWWRAWMARRSRRRTAFIVTVRLAPDLAMAPAAYLNPATVLGVEEPEEDGWRRATLAYADLPAARSHLLGMGGAVEVLSPAPLRLSLYDFARQAARRYEA